MALFYVQEDDYETFLALFPSWAKGWVQARPMFTVYAGDATGSAEGLCVLGSNQVKWFHSYPETRPFLVEQWRHNVEGGIGSWVAVSRLSVRVAKVVRRARKQYGVERMPDQVFLRTELKRYLDQKDG